jgi:CheY-like chemotaxis protein
MTALPTSARVLVVDDHQEHCEGLAELLALKGFETTYTTSGIQGLHLVAEWQPDAVLTDLNLPDLNGSDLCQRIRSNPDWDSIAVIFHTGSEPLPYHGVDCDAFLTYPVATSDLVVTIIGCIARRQRSNGRPRSQRHTQNSIQS